MIFTHDWPFPDIGMTEERYNKHLEVIQEKYQRRIARLRDLRQYEGKVFFFRTFSTAQEIEGEYGWNQEKAKELKNALDRYFPHLDFTLVVLSCSDPNISEIGDIEGVLEFKIKELYIQENYLEMFNYLLNRQLNNPIGMRITMSLAIA